MARTIGAAHGAAVLHEDIDITSRIEDLVAAHCTAHLVDRISCQNAKTTMKFGGPSIMHTMRSGYGAPEPESATQALAQVEIFITHH
ncbi:hypothetical protein R4P70_32245 [Rhodococcus sp. IEGM 1241]|uniref:hypothetical protein n=1 Tax=Rhodococcus sp. IEGM 1241 TaxID=3082228 RepID=UPI00295519C6|nr:hypothetical protein [Rhodococcus sp. IEGM 1241]MDV8015985.1 hypothetical protein [Rhodococcus sp. IEGM 1241]